MVICFVGFLCWQIFVLMGFMFHKHCKGQMATFPAFTGGGRLQMSLRTLIQVRVCIYVDTLTKYHYKGIYTIRFD